MSLPSLPARTFHHMANASAMDMRLTPIEAEQGLKAYLSKLGAKLDIGVFEPSGAVHAIVFGEWGHGKSQVLYRTASFVERNHPGVLCSRIIPEDLTALVILKQFKRSVKVNSDVESVFQKAFEKVGNLGVTTEAMECVAQTICEVASLLEFQHTVLLFDEVQKMQRETFQRFLEELRVSFLNKERCVHTMQCHSLASLDETMKLREELGEWMLDATRIQLPSIEMSKAFEFYRQRIADFGGGEEAKELIGEGLAQTFCEATGGNPREMLQIADSVYRRAFQKGVDKLDPETVLEVFKERSGPKPGTRLFDPGMLKRIEEMIPQVLQASKAEVMQKLLKENFGELYVNRRIFSAVDLAARLDIDQMKLQGLLEAVDGKKLFFAQEDEVLEQTEYGISAEFRDYLGDGFDSSGSLSLRELQFSLVISPERRQADVADGLAKGLRFSKFALGMPVPHELGKVGDNEIRGYCFRSHVDGSGLAPPVLVTAICGFKPPVEFLDHIAELLKTREVHRVFLLFYHPELRWAQWIQEAEVEEIFGEYVGDKSSPRIVGITEEDWGEDSSLEPESSSVKFAEFFAKVAGLAGILDSETHENVEFAGILERCFQEKQIAPEELCYLPSDDERSLLSSLSWSSDWKEGVSRKNINDCLGENYPKPLFDRLVPQFLVMDSRRYLKADIKESMLAKTVWDVLSLSNNKLKRETISKRVGERALIPSGRENLDACVEWVLGELYREGHVNHDLLGYELLNLRKDIKVLRREIKALSKSAKSRVSKLKTISDRDWNVVADRIEVLDKDAKINGESAKDTKQILTRVKADLRKLVAEDIDKVEESILEEREKDSQHLKQKFDSLSTAWNEASPDFRDILLAEEKLNSLESQVNSYSESYSIEKAKSESKLRAERQDLLGQIGEFEKRLNGNSLSNNPRVKLAGILASGQRYRLLQVCIEKEFE